MSSDSSPDANLSDSDRQGLHAAYEAARHAVTAVSDGHRARAPHQQWSYCFDGRGVLVEPDAGGWSWGLEFKGYGFLEDEMVMIGEPDDVRVDGGQVIYHWDATLDEWYKNGRNGLEHGFTVHQRPNQDSANCGETLRLALGLRGNLQAVLDANEQGARFIDSNGVAALTYSGLYVFDADGQELVARIRPLGEGLAIEVDTQSARYPLTIDPVVRPLYVKASNAEYADEFGFSVAVSGDYAVVGAIGGGVSAHVCPSSSFPETTQWLGP